MEKLIPGWTHQPGWHCASTVISDVMTFKGMPMSEAMCFGLGAGLGFAYFEGKIFNPTRMTATRSRILEANFFECIGLPPNWHTSPSPEKALENSKQYIDQDVPVLMRADIFHLDYYNSKSHFPGHVICMWGYDDEKQKVLVADTERDELQAVPYPSIQKARFTKLPGFPPTQGDHLPGDFTVPDIDWTTVIEKALLKQARYLIDPEFGNLGPFMGFPAMEKAAERLPAWAEAEDWAWSARWFYQVIEKRGTGGGAFRKLYANFLEEIAKIEPKFSELAPSHEIFESARMWTELSRLLKNLSEKEKPEGFDEAAQRLTEILEREKEFFSRVQSRLS